MKKWILLSLLGVFCVACGGGEKIKRGNDVFSTVRLEEKVGEQVVSVLRSSEAVQVFRLGPPPVPTIERLGDYPILETGPYLTLDQVGELRGLLLNDEHYQFDLLKRCVFVPDVGYVFQTENDEVGVFISFSCKQVQICFEGNCLRIDIDSMLEMLEGFSWKVLNSNDVEKGRTL